MKKSINTILLLLFILLILCAVPKKTEENALQEEKTSNTAKPQKNAGITAAIEKNIEISIFDTGMITSDIRMPPMTQEERAAVVYTFLQGPRAYREGWPWSGEWCGRIVGRNSFGGFGCGFCCMANIYSTLSPYECSPWDMYEFAISSSFYYPSRESGAIGWRDMQMALRAAGLSCSLQRKPESYETFREQMEQAKSAVVLVSSANDDAFWPDTPGHYVNIWYYRRDTDEVFLAEPGNPENNRSWIPLRYVYDALKTVSQYQYLAVASYSEGANVWKWDGIDDVWNGKKFDVRE